MKNSRIAVALGFPLLVATGGVLAQESAGSIPVKDTDPAEASSSTPAVSYTFAEANYFLTDLEDTSIGVDGFGLRGGYLVTPDLFVTGGYRLEETDDLSDVGFNGTVEITTAELGVGYRMGLGAGSDFNGGLEVIQETQEGTGALSGQKEDETGYRIRLGVRTQLMPNLEVHTNGAFVSLNHDHEAQFTTGAVYDFLPYLGAGADVRVASDDKTYALRVRYRF